MCSVEHHHFSTYPPTHTHDFNIIYIVFAQLLLQVDRSMRRLLLSLLNLSCWTLKNYALVTFILKISVEVIWEGEHLWNI